MTEEKTEQALDFSGSKFFESEEFKDAYRRYHAVFDEMPQDKREVIELMRSCWATAWNAYNSAMGYNGEDTDDKKIMRCGTFADAFLMRFEAIQRLLGNESVDSVLKKMNSTSKWLIERGLFGLPTPVDRDNIVHHKTADGMYEDMKRYSQTRKQLIQRLEASDEDDGRCRTRR